MSFDPNGPALDNGYLFGMEGSISDASLIILPAGWDATVSHHEGTAEGPRNILKGSQQIDLLHPFAPSPWQKGIFLTDEDNWITEQQKDARKNGQAVIKHLEQGGSTNDSAIKDQITAVNQASEELNERIASMASEHLEAKKTVGLVGGDHSTPLGLIRELANRHEQFGILQIDAHADLRPGYQGFEFSHASIMHHALQLDNVVKLVQVGIRDISQLELDVISGANGRVQPFFDPAMRTAMAQGTTWHKLCADMMGALPENIYISIDIDGLEPSLCPNTGTPVPGGLSYNELVYLLQLVYQSRKKVIGFDLVEVGNDEARNWDGEVAARVLYLLSGLL